MFRAWLYVVTDCFDHQLFVILRGRDLVRDSFGFRRGPFGFLPEALHLKPLLFFEIFLKSVMTFEFICSPKHNWVFELQQLYLIYLLICCSVSVDTAHSPSPVNYN